MAEWRHSVFVHSAPHPLPFWHSASILPSAERRMEHSSRVVLHNRPLPHEDSFKFLDLTEQITCSQQVCVCACVVGQRLVRIVCACVFRNVVHTKTKWHAEAHRSELQGPRSEVRGPRSKVRGPVRGPRTKVRGPRSEVRGPRSEVQGPRSKVRGPVRGPRSKVRGPRSKDQGPRSEVRGPRSKVRGPRSEVQGPRSEVQGPRSKVRGPRSKVQGPRSKVRGPSDAARQRQGMTYDKNVPLWKDPYEP
jgi:hypothetical protein